MTLEFPACASLGGAYMAPVDGIAPLGWNDVSGIILDSLDSDTLDVYSIQDF